MEAFISAALVLALIFVALGFGVWIFSGLLLVAVASLAFVADFSVDRIGVITKTVM